MDKNILFKIKMNYLKKLEKYFGKSMILNNQFNYFKFLYLKTLYV